MHTVSLYAVGKTVQVKINAARLSAVFQILLGLGVAVDVLRHFISGSEPESTYMIIIGIFALIANAACLVMIANIGVITVGLLVSVLASSLPDLIIGLIISVVVINGGISVFRDVRNESLN